MAFLGIRVPEANGRLLSQIDVPGQKESITEYHITMLYFGENWPIDKIAETLEVAYDALENVKPFMVETSEVSCFPKSDDDLCAIIAKIKSPALHDLNEELKKAFDKAGIEYSKKFKDYNPHITLAYSEEEVSSFEIYKTQFEVSSLTLWCGDYGKNRLFIDFMLKAPHQERSASFLLQKADFFCKVAENQPQKNFTTTAERRKNERN